jgi:hypothetical protein
MISITIYSWKEATMSKSDNTPKRNLQRRPSLGELMKLANNESTPNVVEDSSEADAIQTIDTVAEVPTTPAQAARKGTSVVLQPNQNASPFLEDVMKYCNEYNERIKEIPRHCVLIDDLITDTCDGLCIKGPTRATLLNAILRRALIEHQDELRSLSQRQSLI